MIACSAGNHAQGVAYHASRLGIPAVIVMPRHTPFVKVEHTRKHGVEVILHGDDFDEAKAHALALAAARGLTLVHPYDDEKVIAGQGTIALEMLREHPQLDLLLIAVGGGGLVSGHGHRGQGPQARHRGDGRADGALPLDVPRPSRHRRPSSGPRPSPRASR